jgi:hypothetical protein
MRSTRTVREEEREKGVRWCKPSVGNGCGGVRSAATVGGGERGEVTAAVLPVAHSATLEIG